MQLRRGRLTLRPLLNDIIGFIYPPYCAICEDELEERNRLVCESCYQSIRFIDSDFCLDCGRPLRRRSVCRYCRQRRLSLGRIRALAEYDETLSRILHLLKYQQKPSLAGRLGTMMGSIVMRDRLLRTADLIVPVPLHRVRKRQRGYNQSTLLARALAESTGLRIEDGYLLREKNTRPQTDLTPAEREHNVSGAFTMRQGLTAKGRRLLLVDDVMTTGATLHACALTLLEAGAAEVYAITCATVG